MRQVSCGRGDVVVDGPIELSKSTANLDRGGRSVGGEQGPEQPVVKLRVEQGHADTLGGEHVRVGVLEPADSPFSRSRRRSYVICALV